MPRSARALHTEALDALLRGRMAALLVSRDFELLAEVARIAAADAPTDLAVTDPALFQSFRAAVTRYHLAGWTPMTPERVMAVAGKLAGTPSPAPRRAANGDLP